MCMPRELEKAEALEFAMWCCMSDVVRMPWLQRWDPMCDGPDNSYKLSSLRPAVKVVVKYQVSHVIFAVIFCRVAAWKDASMRFTPFESSHSHEAHHLTSMRAVVFLPGRLPTYAEESHGGGRCSMR